MTLLEIFGYAASVIVAISLMMSSIVKLRIINLIGSSCFSLYGFLIDAMPVFLLNGFIALINIYYLMQIFGAKEYFRILEVKTNSEYLSYFLKFHEKEIQKFIPTFLFEPNENYHVMFVLRDTVPAGVVISEYLDDDLVYMKLDFAIPGYRDFKMGNYVFAEIFKQKKVKRIYSDPGSVKHEAYLRKMGFVKTQVLDKVIYCLEVK
ncbi:MAG: hypothetical protein FD143_2503 [Ignavibacteria bacterium]|nr:MAG: hypothetical protein FD143_2503 [Ignavibacteria bacterium]KAF0156697.1 MAG: hypothetical protein FD188_2907 [Ignavibacteria bacterium]